MKLLTRLELYAEEKAYDIAFYNAYTEEKLTYRELKIKSDLLALKIIRELSHDKSPIIVYGHKEKEMLISFIACAKSGHPYCPIDTSVPMERIQDIVKASKTRFMISQRELSFMTLTTVNVGIMDWVIDGEDNRIVDKSLWVDKDDTFYIIFTSGSTGIPKGVEISAKALDNYLDWMVHINNSAGYFSSNNVFLNQAPFSFDLSVMDTFVSLYTGGTIWSLDHRLQSEYHQMFEAFGRSQISVWVSTPSFVNMCLMNRQFNQQMASKLKLFLFCGELLTKKTVEELQMRFPQAIIINTYGPTESTVAVTEVEVTRQLIETVDEIPIGIAKKGTEVFIIDEYNCVITDDREKGEIFITGDTLSKGYLNRPDLTDEKFVSIVYNNRKLFGYKTGDIGYRQNKLLYYCGRKDFQVKINGYRIELGDVEQNILKISKVLDCVVIPLKVNNVLCGLAAFVKTAEIIEDEFMTAQQIRKELGKRLPGYMIPGKFIFLKEMKMTSNGKVDRKYLETLL